MVRAMVKKMKVMARGLGSLLQPPRGVTVRRFLVEVGVVQALVEVTKDVVAVEAGVQVLVAMDVVAVEAEVQVLVAMDEAAVEAEVVAVPGGMDAVPEVAVEAEVTEEEVVEVVEVGCRQLYPMGAHLGRLSLPRVLQVSLGQGPRLSLQLLLRQRKQPGVVLHVIPMWIRVTLPGDAIGVIASSIRFTFVLLEIVGATSVERVYWSPTLRNGTTTLVRSSLRVGRLWWCSVVRLLM